MPRLTIDNREIEVPPGTTVLAAARLLGIDVPTLCYLEGLPANTSCLVCTVKLRNPDRLMPSCGLIAADGMVVESECEEVHHIRRTALELLLSDHAGDCLAPCQFACPARMDIPLMLRQIAGRQLTDAIVTVKAEIALPAVLGRACPKPCEKGCRRTQADGAILICQLKRHVADVDLATGNPYRPECKPASDKRVAVVGAGPAGLSAAYYLRREGHAVTLLDDQEKPGGRLRREPAGVLPSDVLDAEIATILALDIELRQNTRLGRDVSLADLCRQYDAVLLACGAIDRATAESWGLTYAAQGVRVDRETYLSNLPAVFAAGNMLRGRGMIVRSVADGHEAALAIDQYFAGRPVVGREKPFSVRLGKLAPDEVAEFVALAGSAERIDSDRSLAVDEAIAQSERCLRCDCRALATCHLKIYSQRYGADPHRFQAQRRTVRLHDQHGQVLYEPGKCIDCGLCVQIAEAAREPLGLAFVGRGFDVRIGVPFDRSLEEALSRTALACVEACPTAALSLKDHVVTSELPILQR